MNGNINVDHAADRLLALVTAETTYHNHKETMAYSAATLLIAASAGSLNVAPFWQHYNLYLFLLFVTLLVISAYATGKYVKWQFDMRLESATRKHCYISVATQWTHSPPSADDLTPTPYERKDQHSFPKFVVKKLEEREPIQRKIVRVSERATFALMALWSIAAIINVISKWTCT